MLTRHRRRAGNCNQCCTMKTLNTDVVTIKHKLINYNIKTFDQSLLCQRVHVNLSEVCCSWADSADVDMHLCTVVFIVTTCSTCKPVWGLLFLSWLSWCRYASMYCGETSFSWEFLSCRHVSRFCTSPLLTSMLIAPTHIDTGRPHTYTRAIKNVPLSFW